MLNNSLDRKPLSYFSGNFNFNQTRTIAPGCFNFNSVEFVYVFVVNGYIEFIVESVYGVCCKWYIDLDLFCKLCSCIPHTVPKRQFNKMKLGRLMRVGKRFVNFQLRFNFLDYFYVLPQKYNIFSHRVGKPPKDCIIYRLHIKNYTGLCDRFVTDLNILHKLNIKLLPNWLKLDTAGINIFCNTLVKTTRYLIKYNIGITTTRLVIATIVRILLKLIFYFIVFIVYIFIVIVLFLIICSFYI